MRLVRLLPGGRPIRGRRLEAAEHQAPSGARSCVSRASCGLWRGPWGQRRLLRTLTLLCVAMVVAGLSLLAVSEVAIAQKRAIQNAARSAARRMQHSHSNSHHGSVSQTSSHQQQQQTAATGGAPGVAFKVEPLLRRDAPSVELSTQVIVNTARAAHLVYLIECEQNRSIHSTTNKGVTRSPTPPPCPAIPPFLKMPLASDMGFNVTVGSSEPVLTGGSWHPTQCSARHRVALVVPYRNRWHHLLTLLAHLHPLLQRQQVSYTIFVVEQYGNDTFNKGAIMNAAFLSVVQRQVHGPAWHNFDCFIFHDVDLLPEDARNLYTCPPQPRHMSVAVDELNYRLPYKILVGGVFAIRPEHFFRVNGYSNLYWGWGGEDDDMGYRVQQSGLLITRPPEWIARYKMIKHVKRRPLAWKVRNKLLRTSGRRYRLDGLNTAQFRLLQVQQHRLFTRLLVDVGAQPNNIRVLQHEADSAGAAAAAA